LTKYYGMRYSAQLELVGFKHNVSKAVIIVHLEETTEGDNPELTRVLFFNNTLAKWTVKQNQTLMYSTFDPNKFVRSDQYTVYIGTSTNEKCERAIIIHSQHSEFISSSQLENLGGSENKPIFEAKTLFNSYTIMQNFAPVYLEPSDPLSLVLKKVDMEPPAFPVAIQFGHMMYNPHLVDFFGQIPEDAIPFWMPLREGSIVKEYSLLPQVALGYKLLVYYHFQDLRTKLFYPIYLVVPNYFIPNEGVQPHKIPIAIRSRYAYPNLSKQVVLVDMIVSYTPPPPKFKPSPPKKAETPDMGLFIKYLKTIESHKEHSTTTSSKGSSSHLARISGVQGNNSANNTANRSNNTNSTAPPKRNESTATLEISRLCTKIKFEVILNVRRSSWKDIGDLPESLRALLNECEEYQYDVNSTAGSKPGAGGEPGGSGSSGDTGGTSGGNSGGTSGGNGGNNKPNQPSDPKNPGGNGPETVTVQDIITNNTKANLDLVKRFCQDHELHVVLNREQAPEIQDYVKHFCRDKVIHNQEMRHLVMLARLKGELSKYLARRDIAVDQLKDKGQMGLSNSGGGLVLKHF
jgi:uncharacterized membrane protein YgcG